MAEDDVRRSIEALPDAVLLEVLDKGSPEYTPFAISVAVEEATKRGGREKLQARVTAECGTHADDQKRSGESPTPDEASMFWAVVGAGFGVYVVIPFATVLVLPLMLIASVALGIGAAFRRDARGWKRLAALWLGFMAGALFAIHKCNR